MLISQNWLKEFYNFTWTPHEISDILTMLGIEVEAIHDQGGKFDGFITAKVLEREKHPNADKLSVCRVFTGRDERTVICGAPNFNTNVILLSYFGFAVFVRYNFLITRM